MSDTKLTLICPPIRTNCYADENPIGYLMRLADKNMYSSCRWLLEGQGIETVDFEKLYQIYLEADWTGFQSADPGFPEICALPNIHLNSTRLRYCPLCLQEENYWRIGWQLKISVACIRHQIWLQDLCPHCQKPYSFVGTRKNKSICLEHLASTQTKSAPESVIVLQQFLERSVWEYDHPLFDTKQRFTVRQRSELLVFLMNWLAIGDDAAKPGRQNYEYVADFRSKAGQCANALFSDQDGFWRYLQTIHLTCASSIGIQQERLVYFYRQFFNEFPEPTFQRLKAIIEQYATMNLIRDITEKHTLFSARAKKAQLWYSFGRACKEYELAPSVLNRAIVDKQVNVHHERTNKEYTKCAIYRPDLEKILPHLKELITARDAAEILGVTKAQFMQLQNNGCFKFEVAPRESYCSTWKYSKLELETLMTSINMSAALPTENCIVLASAMRNRIQGTIDMPFFHVFKAIISGCLIVRKPDEKSRKFRELWLDKDEFCKWLGDIKLVEDSITITEAAKILGINEEFAYQLVNRTYLNHKVDSRKVRMIFTDHIRQFRQEYVILSKLSEASGISSPKLIKILESLDIFPVDHNKSEKLRQRLYTRGDILKLTTHFVLLETCQ